MDADFSHPYKEYSCTMPKLAPLPNTEARAQFNDWLEKLAVLDGR